jgi:hypothetical protein
MRTRYRVLLSWREGLAFRDYEVRWDGYRSASVTPLSSKTAACPGMALSTPMMSKDGQEIAARDEATGTTKMFRLADDGICMEEFDLGVQTSKVGFSDDGGLLAFSSPMGTSGQSVTYVFDREAGEIREVRDSESRGLVIPEVVGPDSLLFLSVGRLDSGSSEFRLVCCIR